MHGEKLCPHAVELKPTLRSARLCRWSARFLPIVAAVAIVRVFGVGILPIPWPLGGVAPNTHTLTVTSPAVNRHLVKQVSYRYFNVLGRTSGEDVVVGWKQSPSCQGELPVDAVSAYSSNILLMRQGMHEVAFAQSQGACSLTFNFLSSVAPVSDIVPETVDTYSWIPLLPVARALQQSTSEAKR